MPVRGMEAEGCGRSGRECRGWRRSRPTAEAFSGEAPVNRRRLLGGYAQDALTQGDDVSPAQLAGVRGRSHRTLKQATFWVIIASMSGGTAGRLLAPTLWIWVILPN